MAISVTNKGSVTTGFATLTTSAFTSTTNRYYLCGIAATGGAPGTPTSTNGITFTLIDSISYNSSANFLYLYGGLCTSGSSGTVSSSVTGFGSLAVDEVTGAPTSGVVVQHTSAAAKTVTLSALTGSDATYLIGATGSGTAPTIEAGWTQDFNAGATAVTLLTGYKAAGDTTPSFTTTDTTFAIIGIELSATTLASFGTAPVINSLMLMGMGV